jgi:hypothetical protein
MRKHVRQDFAVTMMPAAIVGARSRDWQVSWLVALSYLAIGSKKGV